MRKKNLVICAMCVALLAGCDNKVQGTDVDSSDALVDSENDDGQVKTEEDTSEDKALISYNGLLDDYVNAINEQDWDSYKKCYTENIQEELKSFPSEEQIKNRTGLLAVDEVSIKEIKEVELEQAKACEPRFVNIDETEYDNLDCYYVGFDYSVERTHESRYYYDGIKYSFVIIGNVDGVYEIVGFEEAYYFDKIEEEGLSFNNEDESKAREIVEKRKEGVIINFSGEKISD